MSATTYNSSGLKVALRVAGGAKALAHLLGVNRQAVDKWRHVPAERIVQIERLTGVPRAILRPDLYRGRPIALAGNAGTLSLDGVTLLVLLLHHGISLQTIRDEFEELGSDTQLAAIVRNVISASTRA
jgi:DNA-binding transcriptional regulator YdaS (Cro superfamily)